MPVFGIPVDGDETNDKGTKFLEELGYGDQFKDSIVNGCEHKFDRKTNKFCSICGKKSKIKQEAWTYSDLVGEIVEEIEEKTKLDFVYVNNIGWALGINLSAAGNYKSCISEIERSIPILNKYFPNEEPRFFDE